MSTPAQIWGTTTSVTLDTSSPTDDHADTVLHSDHVANPNQRSSRREGPGGLVLISSGSERSGTLLVLAGRQVSTLLSWTSSPAERQCPCRKAGRSDRCWDVVPTHWRCEHCVIRSLRVLPLAAQGDRQDGRDREREDRCG